MDPELEQLLRIRSAEREFKALCARHRVAMVFEQGQSTDEGTFNRFTFKCLPPAGASVDPTTAGAKP